METRKSSCVNARGIPTAAYQVLHVLSCPGGGGVPPVLTWLGYPSPHQTWLGYPRPIRSGWGTPPPIGPGWGTLHQTWPESPPPIRSGRGTLPIRSGWGTPPSDMAVGNPPGVDRLNTLPSPILRMRSVTNRVAPKGFVTHFIVTPLTLR